MSDRLRVASPYDGALVGEIEWDSPADVEAKLAAACRAHDEWRRAPLDGRLRAVRAGLERFRTAGEDVAREVTRQMGKPIVQARREVDTFLARAEALLALAPAALAPEVLAEKPGLHRRIEQVPLGVVLDIAAWNYPLLVTVNVLVPALVAGNAVLLKHSERTPLTGTTLARLLGVPEIPGLVAALTLEHPATARLIADPRIAHVAFTGSVRGGRAVHAAAAQRFVDVGLELGGKDAAYVAADADLELAADGVVDGACYNAGQSCCAVERVYADASVHDELVERMRGHLEAYRMGDPLDEATTLGPLATPAGLDVLEEQVSDAVRRGARLILGGRRVSRDGASFFPPTLLLDVPNDAAAMQEESFGPLVPVRAVAGDAEAVALVQDSRFGLTASLWTRDRARAERLALELDVGTVFQNRCDFCDPELPWTGVRDSGRGTTLSRHGYLAVTRRKSIHFRAQG